MLHLDDVFGRDKDLEKLARKLIGVQLMLEHLVDALFKTGARVDNVPPFCHLATSQNAAQYYIKSEIHQADVNGHQDDDHADGDGGAHDVRAGQPGALGQLLIRLFKKARHLAEKNRDLFHMFSP
mgnify:CR=1 FL=1